MTTGSPSCPAKRAAACATVAGGAVNGAPSQGSGPAAGAAFLPAAGEPAVAAVPAVPAEDPARRPLRPSEEGRGASAATAATLRPGTAPGSPAGGEVAVGAPGPAAGSSKAAARRSTHAAGEERRRARNLRPLPAAFAPPFVPPMPLGPF